MSEKYVNKLIPKARRIYLPRIGSFQKLVVKYIDDRNREEKNIWETEGYYSSDEEINSRKNRNNFDA